MSSKLPSSPKAPVAGKTVAAPAKPKAGVPANAYTNPKPMAKPSPAAPKAKVKDPVATVTPYGISHPKFSN